MTVALLVICLILSFGASIWALVIIFKRSIIGGLLSLFLGLPMLYFLVTGWGKEGEDIRTPFFMSLILYGIAIAIGVSMGFSAAKEVQDQLNQQTSTPPARSSPSFRESSPAAENVRVRDTAPAPTQVPASLQRVDPQKSAQQTQRRPKAAQSDCVYKPVMTDEDMAKCR